METETGLAFLSRVVTHPCLNNLFQNLLSRPLSPPEVIEITGQPGSGKSLFCLDLIAYALLPESLLGVSLGGFGSSVILVDCDHHFNILHFNDLMERKVKKVCYEARKVHKRQMSKSKESSELLRVSKADFNKKVAKVLQDSLKNLIYLSCTSSHQFAVTLLSLNQIVVNKPLVSLIVIDSISSFYWFDRVYRASNWYQMEKYLNSIFKQFFNMLKHNNLICVCTKQSLFKKRIGKDDGQSKRTILNESVKLDETFGFEYLGKEWLNGVTVKLCLSLNKHTPVNSSTSSLKGASTVEVLQGNTSNILYCSFHEDGIRWVV